MPEIHFARTLTCPTDLVGDDSETLNAFCQLNGLGRNDRIPPGNAYTVDDYHPQSRAIIHVFNSRPLQDRQCLAVNVDQMGDESHALVALVYAHFRPHQLRKVNSLIGASATAIQQARLSGLQLAIVEYESALLEVRRMAGSRPGPGISARRNRAKVRAREAYQTLQESYTRELNRVAPEAFRHKNRGNALSNADRGILLAKRNAHRKPDPKLYVSDALQARKLTGVAKFFNHLGQAAVGLDVALRANSVHTAHQEGEDWMREASVQMTGLGLGFYAGTRTSIHVVSATGARAVSAGLLKTGLVASGPKGWGVLGVIVGVGALSGFGVGSFFDKVGKRFAEWIWD